MSLSDRQTKFVEMMVEGQTTKTDIAKILDVSRQTLYDWLDNPEVVAEIDKRLTAIRTQADKQIKSHLTPVVSELLKLALTCTDSRTKNNACQYLINRVLGSPTSNVNVASEVDISENTNNVIEEFKAFVDDAKSKKKTKKKKVLKLS